VTTPDLPRPIAPDGSRKPTLAVVSGRPGSGKSTLARRLAATLSCPVVSRDEINEGIFRTLGRGSEPTDKDQVAKLAFDAFFRALALLVSCDVTFVAEAAFQDLRWRIGLEPLLPMADVKVIRCTIDPDLARERIIRRRLETSGRPGQAPADAQAVEPGSAAVRTFEPLSLPVPSLNVSTAEGYEPRLEEIASFVAS